MTTSKPKTIRLHDSDNVAVARMDLASTARFRQQSPIGGRLDLACRWAGHRRATGKADLAASTPAIADTSQLQDLCELSFGPNLQCKRSDHLERRITNRRAHVHDRFAGAHLARIIFHHHDTGKRR